MATIIIEGESGTLVVHEIPEDQVGPALIVIKEAIEMAGGLALAAKVIKALNERLNDGKETS